MREVSRKEVGAIGTMRDRRDRGDRAIEGLQAATRVTYDVDDTFRSAMINFGVADRCEVGVGNCITVFVRCK